MDKKVPIDTELLEKLDNFREQWLDHRNDLTHIMYFSLAVLALTFFNLDVLDLVAGSAVVKVIDVLALLILFVVPNWAYVERSQGDRMQQMLWHIDEGEMDFQDTLLVEKLREAAAFFDLATRGYIFSLMMGGIGIITLNAIAYLIYGRS